ncbi:MAG: DUF6477 family protein [Roseovarius sp.]|nr:DUF6477 family protein [Roseovarius sp.]
MNDILTTLDSLRRPPLLIRAARIGVTEYRRAPHLRRYLGVGTLPRSGAALLQLIEIEAELERDRKTRAAGYSAAHHVDVLIAMMGEARLLRATRLESVG